MKDPIFLISTTVGFMLLFGIYRTLLSRLTFFKLNRFIIIAGSALIMAIPFLSSVLSVKLAAVLPRFELPAVAISSSAYISQAEASSMGLADILAYIYVGVMVLLLMRLIYSLIVTIGIVKIAEYRVLNGRVVLYSDRTDTAFSFLGWVVLPTNLSDSDARMVLVHELVHVAQFHSLDRIVFEVLSAVMWFNPAVWLLKKELVIVHEFLADNGTVENIGKAEYGNVLFSLAVGPEFRAISSTVNTFSNSSLTKTRLEMMNTKKSNAKKLAGYALLVPAIMATMAIVSCTDVPPMSGVDNGAGTSTKSDNTEQLAVEESADKVYQVVDVQPEFPGGREAMVQHLLDNIKYPKDAHDEGVTGKVYVQFVIDTDGKVTNVEAKNSVYPSLDIQAAEVIAAMPDWTPGILDGENVKVEIVIPISYQLN